MAASDLPRFLEDSLNDTKTEYRRLGNSGLKVSVPIFGSMSFGVTSWLPWLIDEGKVCMLHMRLRGAVRGTVEALMT